MRASSARLSPLGAEPEAPSGPAWSAAVTGYYYAMRDQPDFGVGVASLDRGPLHLEARYNYEARDAGSAFVGWKFEGGDTVSYELTPIIGGLFGAARGVVPGLEASIGWRTFDIYVEAEYVRDLDESSASYFYSWTELGWKPVEWLRVGLVGQRTHTIDNGRDLQRGIFGQLAFGKATLGVYAFNPDSGSRYVIVSLGVAVLGSLRCRRAALRRLAPQRQRDMHDAALAPLLHRQSALGKDGEHGFVLSSTSASNAATPLVRAMSARWRSRRPAMPCP